MELVKIADGFEFPEGPTYDKQGGLFVVNCQSNRLDRIKLSPDLRPGTKQLYAQLPGMGNGTTLHPDGTVYVADYERKAILRVPKPNKVEIVVEAFEEQPLRGPNDLTFDRKANLYFTDPRDSYNQPVGNVYRLRADGKLERIAEGLQFPNGIALDPEEKFLYVAESARNRILRFAMEGERVNRHPEVWAEFSVKGDPDGMRFDAAGNLYVAHFGSGHVFVLDRKGKITREIPTPGARPTNLDFGDPDGKTLFITETETNAVYAMRVEIGRKR